MLTVRSVDNIKGALRNVGFAAWKWDNNVDDWVTGMFRREGGFLETLRLLPWPFKTMKEEDSCYWVPLDRQSIREVRPSLVPVQ